MLDIADFADLTPADVQGNACVIVATMQTLRVNEKNTVARKVYAHNENLEPHFTSAALQTPGLDRIEEGEDKGQVKFSFRNLLALHRPLVIVDEAHNHASPLSVEVLNRIRAACVVEFTATPADDSNILHNVSATELKAEEMIKLPIRLSEHKNWEEAVRDSILTRKRLESVAATDGDYIRPIVLLQAEAKDRDVTKEVLLKHLLEQEHIPREKIAVVTGDQKELDGINLFSRDCKIDFVITVEALKEGWDCSFAYVFCSVATVHSKKDVEQLLGRVLRMPYAKRRKEPDLNRAYAHVSKASWPNAVQQLHDRLVEMGFEKQEADAFIEQSAGLDFGDSEENLFTAAPIRTVIELEEDLTGVELSVVEQTSVAIEKTIEGSRVILTGDIPAQVMARVVQSARSEDARSRLFAESQRHQAVWHRQVAPANRGVHFAVPQLCFAFEGILELAEPAAFLDARGWNLLDYSPELTEHDFRLTESGVEWEIDLNIAGRLTHTAVGRAEQIDLDLVETDWSQSELCGWLDGRCRQPDISQPKLLEFTRRAISFLIEQRDIPLSALVRWRFVLLKALLQKIARHRESASQSCYQETLFGPTATTETSFDYTFDFKADAYAPNWNYEGQPHRFQKHFYPLVGELKNKGQEYDCACALDVTPEVKHWVRNLERRGFFLPLANRKFYPDFVAELQDGRLLVVEHKGEIYATNDDSKEKLNVGLLWEHKSDGKALFLMTVLERTGASLGEQIERKIVSCQSKAE